MKWQHVAGEIIAVNVWLNRQDLEKLAYQKVPSSGFICTEVEFLDPEDDHQVIGSPDMVKLVFRKSVVKEAGEIHKEALGE